MSKQQMDKMREEYEAWFCSTIPYKIAKESWFAVMDDGDYIVTDVQAGWAGWKASRAALSDNHFPDAAKMVEVTSEQHGQFYIGQSVKKVTGEYKISGVVRSVFTKSDGAVRIVVEHTVKDEHGEGSFLHIYGPSNMEPLNTGGAA